MERFLKRRSGPAGGPSFDALPDELLLAVFQLLPEVTSQLLGSAFELGSRGPIERVCRRWRRLALQLPASLSASLCELHDLGLEEEASTAAFKRLLPHLSCRRITALRVLGCTFELPPEIPADLAHALYPQLRSLHLGGASLLHFGSFLSLCRCLEQLTLCTSSLLVEARHMLRTHLCGLRSPLQQLQLHLQAPDGLLLRTIRQHMPLAALSLSVGTPAAMEWLPQLQQCTILLQDNEHLELLRFGLGSAAAEQLSQLHSLIINDERPLAEREMIPPTFPALAHLPALQKLECDGSMVEPAWQCPHLTSLRLVHVPHIGVDDTSGAKCTGLRQLQLERCSLDEWAISSHLCTTLCQLSSLQILDSEPFRVPPQFSALSALRQLVVTNGGLDDYDLHIMRWLPGLTALHLPHCKLEGLPDGPYLSGLRSLDLSGNNPGLASPIPFVATAASGLQALRVNCNVAEAEEWWQDVHWKLRFFPTLKVLCLDLGRVGSRDPQAVEAIAERIRSELPSGCQLDLNGQLSSHPEYSGLADFD